MSSRKRAIAPRRFSECCDDCLEASSTRAAALPVSSAPSVTPAMLLVTSWVPLAASCTLAAISWVEEQNAATGEIARNVQAAAAGTHDVSSNIAGVNNAAKQSSEAANHVVTIVGDLTKQSDILRSELEKFLAELRAA